MAAVPPSQLTSHSARAIHLSSTAPLAHSPPKGLGLSKTTLGMILLKANSSRMEMDSPSAARSSPKGFYPVSSPIFQVKHMVTELLAAAMGSPYLAHATTTQPVPIPPLQASPSFSNSLPSAFPELPAPSAHVCVCVSITSG